MSKLREILRIRVKKAQNTLSQTSADAWVVASKGNDMNLEFLLGNHPHSTTITLLTENELQVVVSSLEESLIPNLVDEVSTYYGQNELTAKLHTLLGKVKGKQVLLDNSPPFTNSHAATILASHESMITRIGSLYGISFDHSINFIKQLRTLKTKEEQEALQKAVDETLGVINNAVKKLNEESTEKTLSAELYRGFHTYGEPAFEPIVAFGTATTNPHYIPQEKALNGEDILYVDAGLNYNSICADITRTYFTGEPSKKQKKAYKTLVKAQDEAINLISEGVPARKLDLKAREVIEEHGFNPEKFSHGLGHAIGVEAHDVGAALYKKTDPEEKLQAGQMYTIEPALYFEEWGIRLEDDVIVKKEGCKRLSKSPKEPPVLKD